MLLTALKPVSKAHIRVANRPTTTLARLLPIHHRQARVVSESVIQKRVQSASSICTFKPDTDTEYFFNAVKTLGRPGHSPQRRNILDKESIVVSLGRANRDEQVFRLRKFRTF
jgi:hypothetical protein